MRLGHYAEAAAASRRGWEADQAYIRRYRPSGAYPMMFPLHNLYFLWAALLMDGRSAEAAQAAAMTAANIGLERVREHPMLEDLLPLPLLTMARFGRWDKILREPRPPLEYPYWVAFWHYARALALASTGQARQAEMESRIVAAIAERLSQEIAAEGNSATARLRLASVVLRGELDARGRSFDAALRHLRQAVELQDRLPYTEPPAWFYPVRHSLGATLMEAGKPAEAEAVYREDLRRNPGNGWSLFGLAKALRTQGKLREAREVEARFRKAWARADVVLTASRF
jgi:tetratricopeptide (TPR) repeat protein